MPDIATRRRFLLFLVKPSHYDDEGYVIQWWKSALPSNSLACLFGIAQKCMEDQVLGEDVAIEIFPVDETNTRALAGANRPPEFRITAVSRGRLCWRAVEPVPAGDALCTASRSAGVPVVIGGFHVPGASPCYRRRSDLLEGAPDLGISLYAGEAEGGSTKCCATQRRGR
jgi:hypothetical protein